MYSFVFNLQDSIFRRDVSFVSLVSARHRAKPTLSKPPSFPQENYSIA